MIGSFVCVEYRENDTSITKAAEYLRDLFTATSHHTAVIIPFFHLSRRAIVADDPRRIRKAIDSLVTKLDDVPVVQSSFGFHKDMFAANFALVRGARALYGTNDHRRPALECVMCRCSVAGRERFWVFVWASSNLSIENVRAAARDVQSHQRQFATPDEEVVVSMAPFGETPTAGEQLAAKLGCPVVDDSYCADGLPDWRIKGAPGSVVYRSYEGE